MIGGVVGLISCIMCSVPFWIISHYGKESHTPLSFWSGDGTLKEKDFLINFLYTRSTIHGSSDTCVPPRR